MRLKHEQQDAQISALKVKGNTAHLISEFPALVSTYLYAQSWIISEGYYF